MKPLRGGVDATRDMAGKVGADTGCVDHPNANGGAKALRVSVRPLLPLTRYCRSARLLRNRTVPVEAATVTGRTRSPEIRWGRDPPNDCTANGSAGVNSAPDLGGQRGRSQEDRGDGD